MARHPLVLAALEANLPEVTNRLQQALPEDSRAVLAAVLAASKGGHVQILRALLTHAPTAVSALNHNHDSGLHLAVQSGRVDAARYLLEQRADPNARNSAGSTPIHLAAGAGQLSCVGLLARSKADLSALDSSGNSTLAYAARSYSDRTVRCLVGARADPNHHNRNGTAPLHMAAGEGKPAVIRALVECGANLSAINLDGDHALGCAIKSNRLECVRMLLELRASPNQPLQASPADPPLLPLILAAERRDGVEIARALLEYDADANALTHGGYSPLHVAALSAADETCFLLINFGCSRALPLPAGCDPDIRQLIENHDPPSLAEIDIVVLSGEQVHHITISPRQSVRDLKDMLKKRGIPIEHQLLSYNGIELYDRKRLFDIPVRAGIQFTLTIAEPTSQPMRHDQANSGLEHRSQEKEPHDGVTAENRPTVTAPSTASPPPNQDGGLDSRTTTEVGGAANLERERDTGVPEQGAMHSEMERLREALEQERTSRIGEIQCITSLHEATVREMRERHAREVVRLRDEHHEHRFLSTHCRQVSRLRVVRTLGTGAYGTVMEVKCIASRFPWPDKSYALKVCTNFGTSTPRVEYMGEFNELALVPSHDNIVRLFCEFIDEITEEIRSHLPVALQQYAVENARDGTTRNRRTQYVLLEYFDRNLKQFLDFTFPPPVHVPASMVTRMLVHVGSALLHLETQRVVHRDIKLDNILVELDPNDTTNIKRCVLSDFGTAVQLDENLCLSVPSIPPYFRVDGWGNLPHTAPELHLQLYNAAHQVAEGRVVFNYAKQAVFELGVLAFEIIVGRHPIPDYPHILRSTRAYGDSELPTITLEGIPVALGQMLRSAVAYNPNSRPTLAELLACLSSILQE